MEFITNQKGRQSLIWDRSKFTMNRKMDNVRVEEIKSKLTEETIKRLTEETIKRLTQSRD